MNGQLVDQQPIELQELVKSCQLPALPQTAISLMRLAQDPENGPEEFAAPIEADPGLASQVLKFVNSSYFGFSGEISAVKMAITLVGIRTIQNFALWSAVFNLMPNPKCGSLEVKKLWQDSLRRALFARLFAKDGKCAPKDAEEIFAAALLQDLAIPLLAKELPEAYEQMFSKRGEGVRLSDLEQERFGWTHAEAAEVVAAAWKLPDSLGGLIGGHLQPGEPGSDTRWAAWPCGSAACCRPESTAPGPSSRRSKPRTPSTPRGPNPSPSRRCSKTLIKPLKILLPCCNSAVLPRRWSTFTGLNVASAGETHVYIRSADPSGRTHHNHHRPRFSPDPADLPVPHNKDRSVLMAGRDIQQLHLRIVHQGSAAKIGASSS